MTFTRDYIMDSEAAKITRPLPKGFQHRFILCLDHFGSYLASRRDEQALYNEATNETRVITRARHAAPWSSESLVHWPNIQRVENGQSGV